MCAKDITFIVEEDPEGGYTAKALECSVFTEADTLLDLKKSIKEALECHFDPPSLIPQIINLHIVREETLSYATITP